MSQFNTESTSIMKANTVTLESRLKAKDIGIEVLLAQALESKGQRNGVLKSTSRRVCPTSKKIRGCFVLSELLAN